MPWLHRAFAASLCLFATVVACGDDDEGAAAKPGGTASTGCEKSGAKGYQTKQTVTVNGQSRTYDVFVPENASAALPLVFVFHGDGGTGANIRSSFKLEEAANGGAIFVYPDGRNKTWDLDTKASDNADYALVDAVIGAVAQNYCVDATRVFATGYSRGGFFTNQLGCFRGNLLRAIAPHAGGGPYSNVDSDYGSDGELACPTASVPALITHGESDGEVSIDDGEKARDYWRKADGCGAGDGSPYDPSPCVQYAGCAKPVVWCQVPGLGHQVWPQNGAAATWKFFASF